MPLGVTDRVRFSAACARAILRKPEGGGIGLLGEKALHSALKYYYEPDAACHEREAFGFVADVRNEDGIIEIQTRNLFAMKRKLKAYLGSSRVTLMHPIVRKRLIIYMDPATGELSRPRLSPKRGRLEDAYSELVHIPEALSSGDLTIVIPMVDAEEYRVRDVGRKRRRGGNADLKYELLPTELISETVIASPDDHLCLLPEGLKDGFTVKELSQAAKLPYRTASAMCAVMCAARALERERAGRSYLYRRKKADEDHPHTDERDGR